MTDPLIDQIRAAPEDDAPRLVWADRVGGERGELVVVQCALAAGGRPRAELFGLHRRQRELLRLARTWPETGGVRHHRFARGFLDHSFLWLDELDVDALFARAPLLRSIEIRDRAAGFARLPHGRIQALRAKADDVGVLLRELATPGRELRALDLVSKSLDATPGVVELLAAFPALEELRIGFAFDRGAAGLIELLHALPRVTRLATGFLVRAETEKLVGDPIVRRLTELEIGPPGLGEEDLMAIAESPHLDGLRRLSFEPAAVGHEAARRFVAALRLPALRELDLRSPWIGLDDLRHSPIRDQLVMIGVANASTYAVRAVNDFPALERLHVPGLRGPSYEVYALDDLVPFVTR